MKKSAYLSDVLFAFTLTALPLLCYLRYRGVGLGLSLTVSVLCGVAAGLLVAAVVQRRCAKRHLRAAERRAAEMLWLHLALLTPREQAEFLAERIGALTGGEEQGTVTEWEGHWFAETPSTVYHCRFSASPITADDALPLLSHPTEKEIMLYCGEVSPEAEKLCARFSLRVRTAEELYTALKEADLLPTAYKSEAAFAKKKKRRIALWFQKRNARPFFTGGTLVLFTSLFTPFPYYYLVMGCCMLLTAALVRLLGKS